NDQRGARETGEFLVAPAFRQRPFPLLGKRGKPAADLNTRLAAVEDEAPGSQPAMVRYARSNLDEGCDLSVVWRWLVQFLDRHGTTGKQKIDDWRRHAHFS